MPQWKPVEVVDGGSVVGFRYDGELAGVDAVTFPVLTRAEAKANAKHEETPAERERRIKGNRNHCFNRSFLRCKDECRFELTLPGFDALLKADCMSFVDEFVPGAPGRRGRIFHGPHSKGKTYMAACICNGLIDRGYRCLMTTMQAVRDDVRAHNDNATPVLSDLAGHDLVVLDDLFRDSDTDTVRDLRNRAIEALCNSKAVVIVTCNLSRESLNAPRRESNVKPVEQLKVRCKLVDFSVVEGNLRKMRAVGL